MGHGHSVSGIHGMQEGELAILCPAILFQTSNNIRWLYSLFIGIDANFQLKRINVLTEEHDPGLNNGHAYIVGMVKFKEYLEEYNTKIPEDKSTCHNHDTIKLASMWGGKSTAATGIVTVECSRHDMKCLTAMGDLQKGERYIDCLDVLFIPYPNAQIIDMSISIISFSLA